MAHVRDLRRVWAVLRRRHQRDHQERRQRLLGQLPPQHVQAVVVDCADAVRGRATRGRPWRQPGPRDHARRHGRQGPPVVLLHAPDHAAGGDRHVQRHGHPLRHRRDGGLQPDQADRDPRAGPHAVGKLPAQSPEQYRLDLQLQCRAEHDLHGPAAARPVRHHLPRRAHKRRLCRGAVLAEAARVPRFGRHVQANIFDSPIITRTQALAHYNALYFDATDPEDRNNWQLTGNVT